MDESKIIKVGWVGHEPYLVPLEAVQILQLDARREFERRLLRHFRERCTDAAARRALREALSLARKQ